MKLQPCLRRQAAILRFGVEAVYRAQRLQHIPALPGNPQPLDVGKAVDIAQAGARELVCLDDALDALAAVDPRKAAFCKARNRDAGRMHGREATFCSSSGNAN
jgi:hypothetical protein